MNKSTMTVNQYGDKEWQNEKGELHREDGPAIEYENGDKSWYFNGQRHREDGPAVEYANGDKVWYLDGLCHREDGPAIEYTNGIKCWYLNGKLYREDSPATEKIDYFNQSSVKMEEKRLPDAEGWWARKCGTQIDWFYIEELEGIGMNTFITLLNDFILVAELTSPLTRWAGPFQLPWKNNG